VTVFTKERYSTLSTIKHALSPGIGSPYMQGCGVRWKTAAKEKNIFFLQNLTA
jgi:hypothetical protein